jgi:hypothetical protein
LTFFSSNVFASFHEWDIAEIYSNADGSIQFVELITTANGQDALMGRDITATSDGNVKTFTITNNVDSQTANKSLLFATAAFSSENGGITPDFVIPDAFFNVNSSSINIDFAGVDSLQFSNNDINTNGYFSINSQLQMQLNSPTNFAGTSGVISGDINLTTTSFMSLTQFPALFTPPEICCKDFHGTSDDDDNYGTILSSIAGLTGENINDELAILLNTGQFAPVVDWITAPAENSAGDILMRSYSGQWTDNQDYIQRAAGLGKFTIDVNQPSTINIFSGDILTNGDLSLYGPTMTLPIIFGPQSILNANLTDVEIDGNLRFNQNDCLGICSSDLIGGDPVKQGGLELSAVLTLDAYFTALDTGYRQCGCAGIDPNQAVITFGENIGNNSYEASCTANIGDPSQCSDNCSNLTNFCSFIFLNISSADYDSNNNSIIDAYTLGLRLGLAGASVSTCVGNDCPESFNIIFNDGFEDGVNNPNPNSEPVVLDQAFNVDEGAINGTLVGSVIATDADPTSPNNTLSWAIIGGLGSEAFTIDENTGELTVFDSNLLDFATLPIATLTLMVQDAGSPRLADTAVISITINNIIQAPIANDDALTIDEDSILNSNVFTDNGSGIDTDDNGTNNISVIQINSSTDIGIDVINADGSTINLAANGDLIFTPAVAYQQLPDNGQDQTSFTYTIIDNTNMNQATATVTVDITGLNDAPIFTQFTTLKVALIDNNFEYIITNDLIVDPDGDSITLTSELVDSSILPTWLTFDASNKTYSGMALTADRALQFIRVIATDTHLASASQVFALAVVDNEIVGTTDADLLTEVNNTSQLVRGMAENDALSMGNNLDIYFYKIGDGLDVIDDNGSFDDDWLLFEGHSLAEAQFSRFIDSNDLYISFANGDEIIINDALNGSVADELSGFAFDYGESITIDEIRSQILLNLSSATNDHIEGFTDTDILNPGAGADSMVGNNGSDLYQYFIGDGADYISDNGSFDTDRLEITGYTTATTNIRRIINTNDVLLEFTNTDKILILDTINGSTSNQVEEIAFIDSAEVLSMQDIRTQYISQNQSVNDDNILGFGLAETFNGGAGNDVIQGFNGSDTYVYGNNDGYDRIRDSGSFDADKLLINDYLLADANISQIYASSDILIDFGLNNKVILLNSLSENTSDEIESIEFSNGATILTMADLRTQFISEQQTIGDDHITAYFSADTLQAGLGNDYMNGADGSDTYFYTIGDGHDIIKDSGSFDTDVLTISGYNAADATLRSDVADSSNITLEFSATDSIQLISALSGNSRLESIVFDDFTWDQTTLEAQPTVLLPVIDGTNVLETLVSTTADEVLRGLGGNDTYQFSLPFGHDIIDENSTSSSDTVQLIGINSTDVIFAGRTGYETTDLIISVDSNNSIIIKNFLSSSDRVESYEFTGDGVSFNTIEIQNILIANQQKIDNDLVQGFSGDNILNAGAGDDLLVGGDGSDIYNYQIGNGNDIIDDNGFGDTDVLQITGYLSTQANFSLLNDGSNDFVIKFNDNDSITLVNSIISNTVDEIEKIMFLDDNPIKTYTTSDLQALFINQQITAGDDVTTGFNSANTIPASGGNDLIFGTDGADTYQYDSGSGHDRIEDNGFGDTDKLEIFTYLPSDISLIHHQAAINTVIFNFNANDSITIVNTLNGSSVDSIEEIHFMDDPNNTIWMIADLRQMILQQAQTVNSDYIVDFTNPDIIPSSMGVDRHIGKDGTDIYEFNLGDETLIIDDQGFGDIDELVIAGYTSSQAIYRRIVPGSNDLLIEFIGSNDRIFVMNSLSGASIHIATETVTFQADGISLDIQTEIEPGISP